MSRGAEDWTGIERHGAGYRARVSRGRGVSPSLKHFPAGTPLREMQAWREDERARLRPQRKQRASRGTFEGDARAYLKAVATMPTIKDRTRQIELWIAEFGTRPRDSITSVEIRAVLNRWKAEKRKHPKTKAELPPVSAATINLRKRALQNMYTVLDADADPPRRNPVRSIEDFEEAATRPRDLGYDVIARILARMADRGLRKKGDEVKGTTEVSISKIVARVMAYTGLEPVQLERLTRADIDLEFGFIMLSARKKGRRSTQARAQVEILPLVPLAVEAFRDLIDHDLVGKPIARSRLRRAFKTAAKHEGITSVRLKDLRHSWGTVVVEKTEDLEVARDLLMHESMASTRIYSARVLAKRLQAKLEPLVRHFGSTGAKGIENT